MIDVREGECFIFDDSFEHEAWNDHPNRSRIVLIIDVWHPSFSPAERKFFKFIRKAQMRVERRAAEEDADGFYQILKDAQLLLTDPKAIWND
jgi:aspartate beta-hydroxylase